jgi:O-antigen/teichoic acid export membrane protein
VTESRRALTRATGQMLAGNMSMMVLQALQFFLLARVLGAQVFGRVAAVNAILTLALPFTDIGFGSLMHYRSARAPDTAPREFGSAVGVTLVGGVVLIGVLFVVTPWVYESHEVTPLVLLQGVAELIGFRTVTLCNQLYLALDRTSAAGTLNVLIAASRVVSIALLFVFPEHGALPWAIGTAVLSLALSLGTITRVVKLIGGFELSFGHVRSQLPHAYHFALSGAARGLFADTDKVLLGRYAPPAELGVYVAAYRIVAMALMPVRSLIQAASASSARSGSGGLESALMVSHRLLRFALPYAGVAVLGLSVCAPALPYVLGESYRATVLPLRILSIVLLVQALQLAYTAALNGAGLQRAGARMQLVALSLYMGLSYLVIPAHGSTGAALACVAGEGLLAALVFVSVQLLKRTEARDATTTSV